MNNEVLKVRVWDLDSGILVKVADSLGCPVEKPTLEVNKYARLIDLSDEEWEALVETKEYEDEVARVEEINHFNWEGYILGVHDWLKSNGYIVKGD